MRKPRTTPLDYIIYGVALAIVVVGVFGVYDALFARPERLEPTEWAGEDDRSAMDELLGRRPFAGRKRVTVLLAGVDEREEDLGRADTLLVAFLNPRHYRVALLAIPRDLRVDLPCDGLAPKINHAYACEGGMETVKEVVEELIDAPIDYYAKANFQGFQDVVDELGGVDIEVEDYMKYDDNWGNLHVDFEPGRYHMDGYDAMCFVRYRQPNGRLHEYERYREGAGTDRRLARQQKFLQAVVDQKLRLSQAPRLVRTIPVLLGAIETDLDVSKTKEVIAFLREVKAQEVIAERVPHKEGMIGGIYYDILLEDEFRDLQRTMFDRLDGPAAKACGIEVLNGCGAERMAAMVAAQLGEHGYEATEVGNAAHDGYGRTQIIYQFQHANDADKVRRVLGCGYITPEDDVLERYERGAQLRVIIGPDYEPPEEVQARVEETAEAEVNPEGDG